MKESEIRQRHAKTCFHNTREGNVNCVMSGCQGDIRLSGRHLVDMEKSVDGLLNCLVVWYQS